MSERIVGLLAPSPVRSSSPVTADIPLKPRAGYRPLAPDDHYDRGGWREPSNPEGWVALSYRGFLCSPPDLAFVFQSLPSTAGEIPRRSSLFQDFGFPTASASPSSTASTLSLIFLIK
jgi:hypothetical protein